MTDQNLSRFISVQEPLIGQVEAELAAGCKKSHWMWFIFPQLNGLGRSETAQHYGIADIDEARRYLDHPVLGERLRRHVGLLLRHKDKSIGEILGSPDDLKFRSCLTLFAAACLKAEDVQQFVAGLLQFYDGRPDTQTLLLLKFIR